jgi:fimbrial chaperone protein
MQTKILPPDRRGMRSTSALIAGLGAFLASGIAGAQSLSVQPVNIEMGPGQRAAVLTVINHGARETSVQARVLVWRQAEGHEELTPSSDVAVSPPIATLAPGATQVVRVVLLKPPRESEGTYRILIDQIPPAAEPGTVRIALRQSIPVFAAPPTRVAPRLQFRVESDNGQAFLVVQNDGSSHARIRDIALTSSAGTALGTPANGSPYLLAGTTNRWPIDARGYRLASGESLHLTATSDAGPLDQSVAVVTTP